MEAIQQGQSINRQAKPTEQQLVHLAINGDEVARDQLFNRNTRGLYQTALRLLGNPEDAEDALQEGMLAAYRDLAHFEGRSQFSTWLTRIVINAALMRRRSRRARPAVSLEEWNGDEQVSAADWIPDDGPSPEQICAGIELSERLAENLKGLSPLLRDAFELRELRGLSADEAAKVLGVSRNTLKARLWRARQELAARLGEVWRTQTSRARAAASLAGGLRPLAGTAAGD